MILLDTDVIIEYLRNNKTVVRVVQRKYIDNISLFYSPISKAEVFGGLRKGEESKTRGFFDTFLSIPVVDSIAEIAGFYLSMFSKSHGVHTADSLIAATAKTNNLKLWTFNKKHYPMRDIEFYYGRSRAT